MPRIKNNSLLKGASGHWLGEFVYKQRGANTFIAGMPTIDRKKKATEKQHDAKNLFQSASIYAATVINDPEYRKFYESLVSGSKTAYNIAVSDFATSPKISSIVLSRYTGIPGSEIAVAATKKNTKVTEVIVSIFSPAGVLIEEGKALLDKRRLKRWYYATTQNNPVLPGTKITAVAKDLPGNEAKMEVIL